MFIYFLVGFAFLFLLLHPVYKLILSANYDDNYRIVIMILVLEYLIKNNTYFKIAIKKSSKVKKTFLQMVPSLVQSYDGTQPLMTG